MTPSLWLTAGISHPGSATVDVGNIHARLRQEAETIRGAWPRDSTTGAPEAVIMA
jgi:hypothetical protein